MNLHALNILKHFFGRLISSLISIFLNPFSDIACHQTD